MRVSSPPDCYGLVSWDLKNELAEHSGGSLAVGCSLYFRYISPGSLHRVLIDRSINMGVNTKTSHPSYIYLPRKENVNNARPTARALHLIEAVKE